MIILVNSYKRKHKKITPTMSELSNEVMESIPGFNDLSPRSSSRRTSASKRRTGSIPLSIKEEEEEINEEFVEDEIKQDAASLGIKSSELKELESKDLSGYNMLWLGGDLANYSSADDATMGHLNSIFKNLDSPLIFPPMFCYGI